MSQKAGTTSLVVKHGIATHCIGMFKMNRSRKIKPSQKTTCLADTWLTNTWKALSTTTLVDQKPLVHLFGVVNLGITRGMFRHSRCIQPRIGWKADPQQQRTREHRTAKDAAGTARWQQEHCGKECKVTVSRCSGLYPSPCALIPSK